MENEKEKGFEVIDKRGKREETSQEPAAEAATAEAQPKAETAQEQKPEPGEEVGTADVYSLIQWMILMLSESAWQWMGLHMNPATRKVERDLAQAKLAIDSVVFLADQVAPHVSEEQRRAYRALVSDLRVNFVQQSQRG